MHLERMTLILEIVGQKGEATVPDICSHSDLPKASAYRLVQDLVDGGLLDPVGRGHYAIGTRLKRITEPSQSDQVLLDAIAPVLRQAADAHGAAFFLSRLRGRAVEIIHVETPGTGVSFLHPGLGKRPLHACSCSKAVAAFSPDLAESISGRLKAYTDFTLTDPRDLEAEFSEIRRRGYAECVEEIELGMCSVAVPLGPSGQPPTLSVGATGSVRVFTSSFRTRMGAELLRMADELSGRLGWAEVERIEVSA
ncbi:MAG: IclR family transcriptional regulator [Acidimicrobiia bacterium]|nr:IclR family transcriptional regulator [Acidimicrobiia bacterium]